MALTEEQQMVIDTLQNPSVSLLKLKAVAGSGKTFTLIQAAKAMAPNSGLYLAYNKAIATEATDKFKGTNIECSTIHSLAYGSVVRQYGLKVGFFKASSIVDNVSYKVKKEVVDAIEEFCLSAFLSLDDYLNKHPLSTTVVEDLFRKYLDNMSNGSSQCSHSFYLKLYHIYLANGEVVPPKVDLLMLDEFGDITGLTLEIFKLIKATKKIAVGDVMQNIYSFNKTINGFKELEGIGVELKLTESFRVSSTIASGIESFIKDNVDSSFELRGRVYEDTKVTTKGYIARYNSGLLDEMFRILATDGKFHTTRPVATILELPLILANLGNGKPVTSKSFHDIEKLRVKWESSLILQKKYSSVGGYVSASSKNDEEIGRAYNVVRKHGPVKLNTLAKKAKLWAKEPCDLTLTTAHSSKGLEFSSVEIAPDLNGSAENAINELNNYVAYEDGDSGKTKIQEELRLYYVAASRAMVELKNAKFIKQDK